jgi:glycosyltransferase involved in cell wall biosynthesis
MRPLVSVVIPVYNEQRYLQRCIDSLLKQSYRPFEIVFVDDGSKDRTPELLKENAAKHKNIRFYRQKNAGPGAARNRGVKMANGEIIVLVDADMTFDRTYIDVLTKPIRDGKTHGTTHTKEICANKENLWARSWSINRINPDVIAHGCGVYRAIARKTFLDAGGFDPSKGYFDDNLGHLGNATPVPAVCYHNNPETLGEAFKHSMWVGRSLVQNPVMRLQVLSAVVISSVLLLLSIALFVAGFALPLQIIISLAVLAWLLISFARLTPRIAEEGRYEYLFSIPVIWLMRLGGYYLGTLQQLYRELKN